MKKKKRKRVIQQSIPCRLCIISEIVITSPNYFLIILSCYLSHNCHLKWKYVVFYFLHPSFRDHLLVHRGALLLYLRSMVRKLPCAYSVWSCHPFPSLRTVLACTLSWHSANENTCVLGRTLWGQSLLCRRYSISLGSITKCVVMPTAPSIVA